MRAEPLRDVDAWLDRFRDAWCAAHVASGADPAAVRASADRTTAFYTAVPEEAAADPAS